MKSDTTIASHILIVDDDPTIRSALEALLEDEGFAPQTASNGQEALRMVHDNPPSLILMDLMMPVMNGIDAVRELKADPRTSAIPVIAMSAGFILLETIADLLPDGIIEKPFDIDTLIISINAALHLAGDNPAGSASPA
ncbi:MAG TPA: response regulator [Thermomicrobiales bacterium]|nr:response regulator [Chloroflexota bacterium]HQX62065.1 response regulator [Thermomicrobiales bacterium]HQZ89385.1 response regulator [Thermomicrobiales bacterium]HRA32429.1 response regulator [Thermomicrobiales bacterium]